MSDQVKIPADQIEAYRRDGVVCLRGVLDRAWIDLLLQSWQEVQEQLGHRGVNDLLPSDMLDGDPLLRSELGENLSAATLAEQRAVNVKMDGAKYMWLWNEGFRRFVLESPAGEIVGRTIEADQVRFFWDQIFQKRPGGDLDTYWHTDQGTWPTRGEQLPSMWVPLTSISVDQSLEYIAGSHADTTEYWGRSWNAVQADKAGQRPADRPEFVDYETRRGSPEVRFLRWAMEPGDVMVFHPRLYHGGGPNRNPSRARIALSTRWFGDDVVWHPRLGDVNVPGLPHTAMEVGASPNDDRLFPIVWRREKSATPVAA